MTVRDVLTERVTTCTPATNLAAASALMWESDCGVLPVLDENGALTGVLTDRDICIALGTRNRRPSELTAGEVMGGNPLTCRSTDDIHDALRIMRNGKIRRLPVVDEYGRLEGILSVADITLSVWQGFGTARAVSCAELVTALQAIFAPAGEEARQAAAA